MNLTWRGPNRLNYTVYTPFVTWSEANVRNSDLLRRGQRYSCATWKWPVIWIYDCSCQRTVKWKYCRGMHCITKCFCSLADCLFGNESGGLECASLYSVQNIYMEGDAVFPARLRASTFLPERASFPWSAMAWSWWDMTRKVKFRPLKFSSWTLVNDAKQNVSSSRGLQEVGKGVVSRIWSGRSTAAHIRGCIQKFPNWPPGARTANGTALCH
jgi:hypothetical protein